MNIWQSLKLGEFITLEYGKPLDQADRDQSGAYSVFGANGEIARSNKFYVATPSIIIGRKGSAGELKLSENKFWPLDVTYFVTFDDKKYDLKFLYYLLQMQNLTKLAKGVKPGINRNDVYAIEVRVPPLPEQRRIVAVLDEAFEGLAIATANTEKNLKNAREVFESYLNFLLGERGEGWEERRFGEICENLDNQRVPITKSVRSSGDIPYYGASGIVDYVSEHIFDEDLLLVSEDGANLLARTYPIAFSVSGKCWVNNHAHVVRFSNSTTQRFVELFLNSITLEPYVSGMAQPKLNQKSLNSIAVPLPRLGEQEAIVSKVDELETGIERLEAIFRQKLAAIAQLKQSLLQKAFAGELTKDFRPSVAASSAASNVSNLSSVDLHAGVLAMAYDRHHRRDKHKTFGRVKAQKFLHLVESVGRIDLGRAPIKDAAGPNDFQHMLRAEDWAKQSEFFEFAQRSSGNGYEFRKLARFDEQLKQANAALEPFRADLNKVIDLIIDMNSEEAELFATVHSAWNNLIIDRRPITDAAIVREARENWHPDKLRISEQSFLNALNSIRTRKLEPDGTAKYVGGQTRLI